MNNCHWCSLKIEKEQEATHISYWKPNLKFPVHKKCREESMRFERISCQNIDKSCNDCINFKSNNEKYNGYRKGICLKKEINIITYSNHCYTNNDDCFEHREVFTKENNLKINRK